MSHIKGLDDKSSGMEILVHRSWSPLPWMTVDMEVVTTGRTGVGKEEGGEEELEEGEGDGDRTFPQNQPH